MKFELFASYEIEPDTKSKAIMKATDCAFSHVGIIENEKTIFHATGKGFHSIEFDKFIIGHGLAHRFEVNVKDHSFASGWLRGNVGKDYSESQFLGFLFKIPFIRSLFSDGKSELICSESVVRFGIECCGLETNLNPDFVTPEESVEIMKAVKK